MLRIILCAPFLCMWLDLQIQLLSSSSSSKFIDWHDGMGGTIVIASCNGLLIVILSEQCLLQTPPLTTALIHPSKLHRFLFSPWVLQTPPLRHGCYNPRSCIVSSPWVSYNFLPFGLLDIHFSAMRPTNPSLLDFIGTSLMAASFTVTFAPWVIHTPPSLALVGTPLRSCIDSSERHAFYKLLPSGPWLVHYSKLHRWLCISSAPCTWCILLPCHDLIGGTYFVAAMFAPSLRHVWHNILLHFEHSWTTIMAALFSTMCDTDYKAWLIHPS